MKLRHYVITTVLYLYGVGDVPRGLPFVDLVPAASELATAAGRIFIEAAVVHAERLRRPPGDSLAARVTAALFHAAVRRQLRIARGPERVGVRLAAGLEPAPFQRLRGASGRSRRAAGRGRRARRLITATLHDGLCAPAVLGHVCLDGGPHHVHGRADWWHVEPAEIRHRPLPGYDAPPATRWRRRRYYSVLAYNYCYYYFYFYCCCAIAAT